MAKDNKTAKQFEISIIQTKGFNFGRNVTKFINNAQDGIKATFHGEANKFKWRGNPPFSKHELNEGSAFLVGKGDFTIFLDNSNTVEPLIMFEKFAIISNVGIYSLDEVDPIHFFVYWSVVAVLQHKGYNDLKLPYTNLDDQSPSHLKSLIQAGTLFPRAVLIELRLRPLLGELIHSLDMILKDIGKAYHAGLGLLGEDSIPNNQVLFPVRLIRTCWT